MDNDQATVRDILPQLMESYPLLRKVQAWTDAAYYHVPFLCEGSLRFTIAEFRLIRYVLAHVASIADEEGLETVQALQHLTDQQIALHQEAVKVWRATRDMDAVREVYLNVPLSS